MAAKLTDKEMNELKAQVLIDRIDYLSGELGDPGRYYPALRAKRVLSQEDCERVKAKVTSREKVHELIELIHTRRSEKDGHAMDVLMEALRKQRVQAHIAGELQRALARAKELKRGMKGKDGAASPVVSTPLPATSASAPGSQGSLSSIPSVATPMSRLTTPSTSGPQFEIHPEFGPMPNLPPGRPHQAAHSTTAQPSTNMDPRYGLRPGTPPPNRGNIRPSQEAASPGLGEVATGMSGLQMSATTSNAFSSMGPSGAYPSHQLHYHNGGREFLDRRNSELSYTTTSGTVYSTSSTEQSGLDYGGAQGEFGERREFAGGQRGYGEGGVVRGRVQELEDKVEELQSLLQQKELTLAQARKDNAQLDQKLREIENKHEDLQKQHAQMCEKVRQNSLSEQKQMLQSYKEGAGGSEESAQLRRELQEKGKQIQVLSSQVERYQQDNQQLQLSLSSTGSSLRPHHLPIGSQTARPPAGHRSPYTPPSYQGGVGDTPVPVGMTPAVGFTPLRSVRVGDSLNQHNIHLQQQQQQQQQQLRAAPHRDSPAYSPGKEPASKGPSVFSPGRESGGKTTLFSPGRDGMAKRLSGSSGETPMGEGYFKSSSSSLNSSGSKGSAGVTLQPTSSAEHSTMV